MNNFILTRKERRCFYRMRFCSHTPESKIYNFHVLYEHDFVKPNYTSERDAFNAPITDGTYRLGDSYWRYVEEHRWFNGEFVIRNIIVPVVVGVLSVLITRYLVGS